MVAPEWLLISIREMATLIMINLRRLALKPLTASRFYNEKTEITTKSHIFNGHWSLESMWTSVTC